MTFTSKYAFIGRMNHTVGVRFHDNHDYGEIRDDAINGDRTNTLPMENGYVYVFKYLGGKTELAYAYTVREQLYREIEVADNSINYEKEIGNARNLIRITDYFTEVLRESPTYYVVVSKIALSNERLFSDDNAALTKNYLQLIKRSTVQLPHYKLVAEEQETRSGPQIFNEINDRSTKVNRVNLSTYNYLKETVDGLDVCTLLVPDVESEVMRRNSVYRTRLKKYHQWLNNEARTKDAFVHQAVKSILNQDSGKDYYVNMEYFNQWKQNDRRNFRLHFYPVHYAVENLISWLDNSLFKEVLRDYNFGDDEQQEKGLQLYHDGIRDLFYTQSGSSYLSKKYDDTNSYLAQSTRLLALRPEYSDHQLFSNSYIEIRKWGNIAFGFLEEIAPLLVAKEKGGAIAAILELVFRKTGYALQTINVKPTGLVNKTVNVIDVENFLKKIGNVPTTKGGKGLITFLELGNVALAIHGLAGSGSQTEAVKNSINLIGAGLDFSSSNWLIQNALKNKLGTLTGTKLLNGMILVSGVIDCILGIWEAKNAWEEGEFDVAIGWSIFALGGAIIATGAALKITGAEVTVGSAGTLAEVGIIAVFAGLFVEGVGLLVVLLCNNDEIEDWLTQCKFGTKPSGNSIDQQIQDLNDIMCKFEVEAEFKDIKLKFKNETYVKFIIKPRVINKNSRITFSDLRARGYARLEEYIFGTSHDLVTTWAGSQNPVLDLSDPRNCSIFEEDGRIVKIETNLRYPTDIDEVSGKIKVDVNNGTLQGYEKDFTVSA